MFIPGTRRTTLRGAPHSGSEVGSCFPGFTFYNPFPNSCDAVDTSNVNSPTAAALGMAFAIDARCALQDGGHGPRGSLFGGAAARVGESSLELICRMARSSQAPEINRHELRCFVGPKMALGAQRRGL